MQNKPKSFKEINKKDRYSERRTFQEIKDDIYRTLGISFVYHSSRRRNLDILLHELDEAARHEGASNPYC